MPQFDFRCHKNEFVTSQIRYVIGKRTSQEIRCFGMVNHRQNMIIPWTNNYTE